MNTLNCLISTVLITIRNFIALIAMGVCLFSSSVYAKQENSFDEPAADIPLQTSQMSAARAKITQAINQTDFSTDARLLIERLIMRAEIDNQVGANIAALQDLQFAYRLATSANHQDLVAKVAYQIALIHQTRSEHILALSYSQQAISRYQTNGPSKEYISSLLLSIESLLVTNQTRQARTQLNIVASLALQNGEPTQQASYYQLLAEAELKEENIDASLAAIRQAETLTKPNDWLALARLRLLSSKAYALNQDMDASIAQLVTAFEHANTGNASFFLRQSLQLQRAELLSRLDEYESAFIVTRNIIRDRDFAQPISEIKQMLDMHANFQLQIQQQENADLKQENEWKSAQIETKQTLSRLYLLVMALLFCLSCLLLLVFIRGRKHRLHLEKLAHTDQLTTLHSRVRVFELLRYHQDLYGRTEQDYCVAIVDLDYFKRINDTYGHQVGDQVLRQFGEISKRSFRKADVIGRIGGEEFLFILPNTPYKKAIEVFSQFNKKLLEISQSLNIEQNTTASVGLVTPHLQEKVPDIIKRADDALYQAKHNGRNCVVFGNNLSTLQTDKAKVN